MLRLSDRHPAALGAYALAALLALLELGLLWQTLNPRVSDDYRAYYIDRTTTCLPQPVTGAYTLGTPLDFRTGGAATRELRPCGWDGPAGDGTPSIGESSRLRFAVDRPQDLVLTLELNASTLEGPPQQRVEISAGNAPIGEALVIPDQADRFIFEIPASAVIDGFVDILFDYPDAIAPRPGIANNYWRSIKLISLSLAPQT